MTIQTGNRLWFLFEPGAAVFNGLSNDPMDMDQAAVVEVEILERRLIGPVVYQFGSSPTDRDFSWIQVHCLQVVPLWDIPNHFEEIPLLKIFEEPLDKGAESEKMVEFVASSEGYSDCCYLTKTTPPRAVLRNSYYEREGCETVILNSGFELPDSD